MEDIFSDKPIQKIYNTPIIMDISEKNSLIPAFLSKLKANCKFEHLEIADYIIGDIAIERKTFSDFLSSMLNLRLKKQLKEIKKYSQYFLIIEGENICASNLQNPARGMLLSIILDFKIPILFTQSPEDTANFLFLLSKKLNKKSIEKPIRYFRTQKDLEYQKQFVLEGFPGIGPKTAKKLLEKFKTLSRIFQASEEELKSCLNEIKIEKFRQLLD